MAVRGATKAAYVAMGTNLGDRGRVLQAALWEIARVADVRMTSHLYESRPMYHSDQPTFLNAVCQVETDLSPPELLRNLKRIEENLGRETTFRNGPRLIDLDILFWGEGSFVSDELSIPHPRIAERPFVVRPMCDLADEFVHPTMGVSMATLWHQLLATSTADLHRVIPCYNHMLKKTRYMRLGTGRPVLMGILNVTPDSFSDGGLHFDSPARLVTHAQSLVANGAAILDIGGESTRPGAAPVPLDEELRRVVQAVRVLRAAGVDCLLSIDTRSAAVARAAIAEGADIINDVSAGCHDPTMFPLVGELGVPYIAMHMRGDPSTMTSTVHCSYTDPTSDVTRELSSCLHALDAHLPRWLQLVDPGIGFAKDASINRELLQPHNLRAFKRDLLDRPVVVGLSRKRFLGKAWEDSAKRRAGMVSAFDGEIACATSSASASANTNANALTLQDRDRLTAGANCLAMLGGADILRVHDVFETRMAVDAFAALL